MSRTSRISVHGFLSGLTEVTTAGFSGWCFFLFALVFTLSTCCTQTFCFKGDVANVRTAICHPFLESCLECEADVYLQGRLLHVNKYIHGDTLQFSKCKKILMYS